MPVAPKTGVTFIALYRGPSIEESVMVAATVNPELSQFVARVILSESDTEDQADPVTNAIFQGRKKALSIISAEGGTMQ